MNRMNAIRAHAAPWVWWVVALLVLVPLGRHASGAVLCIEADGAVTVETATGQACGAGIVAAQLDADVRAYVDDTPLHAEPDAHCDDCIDVALPGGVDLDCASFLIPRDASVPLDLAPIAFAAVETVSSVQESFLPERTPEAAPLHLSSLTPLRSVILLI